jgi:hypothetical protein
MTEDTSNLGIRNNKIYNFPFRNNSSGRNKVESQNVEWIREHASYLLLGNLSVKLASFAEYALGLVRNLSVIFPILILLAAAIGYCHFFFLDYPGISIFLSGLVLGFILTIANVFIVNASTNKESRSKNNFGMNCKKTIGWFCLSFIIAAFAVGSSFLIEWGRDVTRHEAGTTLKLMCALILMYLVPRFLINLLPIPINLRRLLNTFLYGLVGGTSIWVLLLVLTDLFIYGNPLAWIGLITNYPYYKDSTELHFVGLPMSICLLVGLIILLFRTFKGAKNDSKSQLASSMLFIFPSAIYYFLFLFPSVHNIDSTEQRGYAKMLSDIRVEIGDFTRPFTQLTSSRISFAQGDEALENNINLLRTLRKELEHLYEQIEPSQPDTEDPTGALTPWAIKYLSATLQYADTGFELASANENRVFNFWQELVKADREVLIDLARKKAPPGEWLSTEVALLSAVAEAFVLWIDEHQQFPLSRNYETDKQLFLKSLNDDSVDAIVRKLKTIGPSALKQNEFATLVGRNEDLTSSSQAIRFNSAYPGIVTYFKNDVESPADDKIATRSQHVIYRNAIRLGTIYKLFRRMSTDNLNRLLNDTDVLSQIKNIDTAFADSIALRAKLARMTISQLSKIIRTPNQCFVPVNSLRLEPEIITSNNCDDDLLQGLAISEIVRRSWTMNFEDFCNNTDVVKQASFEDPSTSESSPSDRNYIFYDSERETWFSVLQSIAHKPIGPGTTDARTRNYSNPLGASFHFKDLINLAVAGLRPNSSDPDAYKHADRAVSVVVTGPANDFENFKNGRWELFNLVSPIRCRIFLLAASLVGLLAFIFVDVNATGIHGLYRDRLSEAFLFVPESCGISEPLTQLKLSQLNQGFSAAPYHLINASVNLQRSPSLRLRDQRCDFFLFSKFFCGSVVTGFAETRNFEAADPKLNLATAMTISAAAASPNMGRFTNPFATFLMALLNIRLGYWFPNPNRLVESPSQFDYVFQREWRDQILPRWKTISDPRRSLEGKKDESLQISSERNLIGLSFSGGGIRAAAFSLGVSQGLDRLNWFPLVDYLSTVSGGGYTGASISAAMSDFANLETNNEAKGNTGDDEKSNKITTWHNPVSNFGKEMIGLLHERSSWINLSDGGHIENLGAIELLRRRCKLIIMCDAEADPDHNLNGLGILIRLARLELGYEINIDASNLRFIEPKAVDSSRNCTKHWAIGHVRYSEDQIGYIIYLKSSFDGRDPENLRQYRGLNSEFPQEPTSDQFFSIEQFDAYRELGKHVFECMVQELTASCDFELPESPTAENIITVLKMSC